MKKSLKKILSGVMVSSLFFGALMTYNFGYKPWKNLQIKNDEYKKIEETIRLDNTPLSNAYAQLIDAVVKYNSSLTIFRSNKGVYLFSTPPKEAFYSLFPSTNLPAPSLMFEVKGIKDSYPLVYVYLSKKGKIWDASSHKWVKSALASLSGVNYVVSDGFRVPVLVIHESNKSSEKINLEELVNSLNH